MKPRAKRGSKKALKENTKAKANKNVRTKGKSAGAQASAVKSTPAKKPLTTAQKRKLAEIEEEVFFISFKMHGCTFFNLLNTSIDLLLFVDCFH